MEICPVDGFSEENDPKDGHFHDAALLESGELGGRAVDIGAALGRGAESRAEDNAVSLEFAPLLLRFSDLRDDE